MAGVIGENAAQAQLGDRLNRKHSLESVVVTLQIRSEKYGDQQGRNEPRAQAPDFSRDCKENSAIDFQRPGKPQSPCDERGHTG